MLTSLLAASLVGLSLLQQPNASESQQIILTPAHEARDVDPGLKELTIRFPEPMRTDAGWSICGGGVSFPKVEGIEWSDDRTLRIRVELKADRHYQMPLNCSGSSLNFRRKSDGMAVAPTPWSFWTESEGPASEEQRRANAESLAMIGPLLKSQYSYRDRVVEDWDAVLAASEPRLLNARDPVAFVMHCAEALSVARDPHLWLRLDGGSLTYTHTRSYQSNFDGRAVGNVVDEIRRLNRAVAVGRVGTGDEQIDYLLITSWSSKQASLLRKADEWLKERSRSGRPLILDVRANGGGNEMLAKRVARLFVDGRTIYAHQRVRDEETGAFTKVGSRFLSGAPEDQRYLGPVCVLQGPACVSSNEAFLLMMKQAERCTSIGAVSGGSSGNPQPYDLGQGIELLLPSWQALDAEQELVEGRGIAPDLEVPFDATKSDGRRDPVLERAIAFLRDR